MNEVEKLKAFIGDIWLELDHSFNKEKDEFIWLEVLGIMQRTAEAFDLERSELGLPTVDADKLMVDRFK